MFGENQAPPQTWPFHVLLSVPLEPDEIERIGAREGWRAKTFGRGMQGQQAVLPRHRVLAGKPADDRGRTPAMAQEYLGFLNGVQTTTMSDPEFTRLMRATHLKEPAK